MHAKYYPGAHEQMMDSKGRAVFPFQFRTNWPDSSIRFTIDSANDGSVYIACLASNFDIAAYEKLRPGAREYHFAKMDAQSRVQLGEAARKAGLHNPLVWTGMPLALLHNLGDAVEIWSKDAFDAHIERARQKDQYSLARALWPY